MPISHTLGHFDVILEKDGILSVSGRVRDQHHKKEPKSYCPLSLSSLLTKLFVETNHVIFSHAGTSTLMAVLAENYYIPRLRGFLKKLSRSCVKCQRAYAQPHNQRMGLLPSARTEAAPPFLHTGVDFAGPFMVHYGNPRKPTKTKVYAALFVCFSTRAIHIELCTDLASETFTAALTCFCSRRGTPAVLYSDNGSNFIGAH